MVDANGIRKSSVVPKAGPGAVGVTVKPADKRFYFDRGNSRTETLPLVSKIDTAVAITLGAEDDGATVGLEVADPGVVVTLPAAAAAPGARFTFLIKGVSSTSPHAISPVDGDSIYGPGLSGVEDKDLQCLAAADAVGDFVTIESDGVLGWWVVGIGEATPDNWASEA